MYSGEFLGRRTIGTASELPMAWRHATSDSWPTPTPCCQSITTASNPAWAMHSAIYGLPVEHQPCTAGLPCFQSSLTRFVFTKTFSWHEGMTARSHECLGDHLYVM